MYIYSQQCIRLVTSGIFLLTGQVLVYGWPSYSQLIIFTSSKNIFTGSRNKTLAKATHN